MQDTIYNNPAPGAPGVEPRWTSSAKVGVGTALSDKSLVWFTLSHGIVDEIYYPSVLQANTRDFGLIVTDGKDYFSEEKRLTNQKVEILEQGVPAFRLINECGGGRYRITKTIVSDPEHSALLQEIRFEALQGEISDYKIYALLAPHLENFGYGNSAWLGEHEGHKLLFARRGGVSLALACSVGWKNRSCGYVGVNDGWQDLSQNFQLTQFYDAALDGNVALTGEIDLTQGDTFCLCVGFGENPDEAAGNALASLNSHTFQEALSAYIAGWCEFQNSCLDLNSSQVMNANGIDMYRMSVAMLRAHAGKRVRGGIIASLSIPWGASNTDDDLGGYHRVWPRDQVEVALALIAAGNVDQARATLKFLIDTQREDGHWPQNMTFGGEAFLPGTQNDETAFPVLIADVLRRDESLGLDGIDAWPMVRKAASYLVRTGPDTQQDRWEENRGYSVFTLAVTVAALVSAANFADAHGEAPLATYLRETADAWEARIDDWTYVRGTPLAQEVGVDGYYVRITPREPGSVMRDVDPSRAGIEILNHAPGEGIHPVWEIVSPDALALVRAGLRNADDPRILNTVKVIDYCLKTETKTGSVWHRYPDDGYGEHADGAPFDGTGIGRGWPLLCGERAHYEVQCGNFDEARRLLDVMAAQCSLGGMLPEQVWESEDIPERELYNGQPSGSAMPLVWAHAELVRLTRSLHERRAYGFPAHIAERYASRKQSNVISFWRLDYQIDHISPGERLRIELPEAALVHWSQDSWGMPRDARTDEPGKIGMHVVDLPTDQLKPGTQITFTFLWLDETRWEGVDYTVSVSNLTYQSKVS